MKALVFGSLNIDRVYSLSHLPEKGEMIRSLGYEIHIGGKGLNQAVALKRAGFDVYISGQTGCDGDFLRDYLDYAGVNTSLLGKTDTFSGHAVIEIDTEGRNQMIIYPGANREITKEYCDEVLSHFSEGDLLLTQYETNLVEYMIEKAKGRGMLVAFNPSPYVPELKDCPYSCVDYLILNEQEGELLTGEKEPEKICDNLLNILPDGAKVILTLGKDGSVCAGENGLIKCSAFKVNAVDTTGAGDTFTGYVLKAVCDASGDFEALMTASAASAIAVTQKGAAETIPTPEAVEEFLKTHT